MRLVLLAGGESLDALGEAPASFSQSKAACVLRDMFNKAFSHETLDTFLDGVPRGIRVQLANRPLNLLDREGVAGCERLHYSPPLSRDGLRWALSRLTSVSGGLRLCRHGFGH
jgi:hypothetical protein